MANLPVEDKVPVYFENHFYLFQAQRDLKQELTFFFVLWYPFFAII